MRRYSQQKVDLIDLQDIKFKTLPVREVIEPRYAGLRYIAQEDQGDYLAAISSSVVDSANIVVTFDGLLRRTPFAGHMRTMLGLLEKHYRSPVDTEFTVEVVDPQALQPEVKITILQCRPQSAMDEEDASIPDDLPEADVILSTRRMVPRGAVHDIRYVLFVPPEEYFNLQSEADRSRLKRGIGALNAAMKCRAAGRGSSAAA